MTALSPEIKIGSGRLHWAIGKGPEQQCVPRKESTVTVPRRVMRKTSVPADAQLVRRARRAETHVYSFQPVSMIHRRWKDTWLRCSDTRTQRQTASS